MTNGHLFTMRRPLGLSALLLLLMLCHSQELLADQIRMLTLDEAIDLALIRNRDIDRAKEYGREVQGRYVEERAAALPQLTFTASADKSRDNSLDVGGLGAIRDQYRQSLEVELVQPLYTWGKIGAAIRAAEVGLKTADDQLRRARQGTIRDVTITFCDILLAKDLNAIARQNLEQKERLQDEARRRHEAGVATDYDVLAAEVAVQNARPEVIRTQNQIRNARERLRFLLALDEEEVEAIGSLATTPWHVPDYETAFAIARERRPELIEVRHRIGIAQEVVTISKTGTKPRLELKTGTGWQHLELSRNEGEGASWKVGVFFTWPFYDGQRARGQTMQAESSLRSLRIDEAQLADNISLQIRDAVNAVKEAEEILLALTGTVFEAQRLLAMAEKGYELGVKIRLEVDDAQLNLIRAKGNLARAQRDYIVSRSSLDWTMGILGEDR